MDYVITSCDVWKKGMRWVLLFVNLSQHLVVQDIISYIQDIITY